MKNKQMKGLVIVLLLVAVLVLGVGYAVITNVTLNVTGQASATTDDANFDVMFVGTPSFNKTGAQADATITAAIQDDYTATIQVGGLKQVGDVVTATYEVENVSPEAITANLSALVNNSNTEYFNVTYSFANPSIAQGETTTITVSVQLIKVVVTTDQTATIDVTITATPQG